jgi:ornithine cyclodeaminase
MLGRDGARDVVGIKTSYKFDPNHDRTSQHYYTSLTLYDDTTGAPVALMDCARIGALRTPAASALIARECAPPGARSALLIGTGTQGRHALPFLLATLPQLDRLMLIGTYADGITAVRDELARHHPDRDIEVVTDLAGAAMAADIVLAAAGPATPAAVSAEWLKPGTLSILVGYGLDRFTAHRADRVIATSAAQMAVTGTDLADDNGTMPTVDAEFPDVLTGRATGRADPADRIFAFNSGLVVTDVALGHLFAREAVRQGLGQDVPLWR